MNLFPIKLVAVVLLIVEGSKAATKTKCQVVSALRAQGVPDGDLRDCKYLSVLPLQTDSLFFRGEGTGRGGYLKNYNMTINCYYKNERKISIFNCVIFIA